VVARATVAFAALGFGAMRLGSPRDLRGLAVCLERSRRVVVEATTSASPDAGCDAAALRVARVVRACAGSALAAALVRRVLTMLLSEIVDLISVNGGCDDSSERRGRSDEVVVRVRTSAGHVPLVRVACRDPMTAESCQIKEARGIRNTKKLKVN
jgi:hypothetical protein